ncbi:MAG: metal-dependent hydrolase [Chloroflexota bacterium]
MRTPSHFLMTATINTVVPAEHRHTIAFLIGSVLPDIPFTILTLIYAVIYPLYETIPENMSTMEFLHFELFFSDPIWIISHNFFHSLVIGSGLLLLGYLKRDTRWGFVLLWLAIGTLLHTVIDIFTHHSDGPLFLFPLNWTYRFASPISYWEPDYFGNQFRIFEYLFNVSLLIYLLSRWLYKQRLSR